MTPFSATWLPRDGAWATALLLLTVALLGVAHVAFLPPFEGYDEPAHYSYIQQLADLAQIPRLGEARISRDVDDYPGPLAASRSSGEADQGRGYRAYFSSDHPALPDRVPREYRPGKGPNWEAQHPPLYYFVMAPLYRLTWDWSWQANLLALRLFSWGIAFAGFVIGSRATQRTLAAMGQPAGLGLLASAWPLLFPEFFPEMARLGNDSLCLFFAGLAWALILRLLEAPNWRRAACFGIVMGLGLLTKALFLPIAAGSGAVLALAVYRRPQRGRLADLAIAAGMAVAIGLPWYLRNLLLFGSLVGSADLIDVEQGGGVIGLIAQHISAEIVANMLRGLGVIVASFVWAGTWSRAILTPLSLAPILLLAATAFALWLKDIGRWSLEHFPPKWAPVRPRKCDQTKESRACSDSIGSKYALEAAAPLFLAAPVLAGLVYRDIAHNLLPGTPSGTPGWYFHILAAPLSLALALGWQWRRLFGLLAGYAVLFHAACWASQLSFFSGCSYKPGPHMWLRFDPGSCFISTANLAALGEPALGFAALAAAGVSGIAALSLLLSRSALCAADRSLPTGTR